MPHSLPYALTQGLTHSTLYSVHWFTLSVLLSLAHSLTHPLTHVLRQNFQSTDLCAACVQTEDCVEAHTNVDVVVNVNEFRALLQDRLPHVWAGKSVSEAAIPWPEV